MSFFYRILARIPLYILLLLFVRPGTANGQTPGTNGSASEDSNQSPTTGESSSEAKDLDPTLPTSEPFISEEISRTKSKIEKLEETVETEEGERIKLQQRLAVLDKRLEALRKSKDDLLQLYTTTIAQVRCDKAQLDQTKKSLSDLQQKSEELANQSQFLYLFIPRDLRGIANINEKTCGGVIADLNNKKSDIERRFTGASDEIGTEKNEINDSFKIFARNAKRLKELEQRLRQLVEVRKTQAKPGEDVVQKLPWLIFILGVFSLSIMVMVRRFSDGVQRAWVDSGQVIQFMTVTIIVITVLALGLANKLQEEALGTLLGAIAGHVLSKEIWPRMRRDQNDLPAQEDSARRRRSGGAGGVSGGVTEQPPQTPQMKAPEASAQAPAGGTSQSTAGATQQPQA